jgi:hypothetical protein
MSGATLTLDQLAKLDARRNDLMGQVFYAYASSDLAKCKIDTHNVTMALDQWSWYWIGLEAMMIVGLSGAAFYLIGDYFASGTAAWVVVAGLGALHWIRTSCRRYALDQIHLILKVNGAKDAIRQAFSAL